MEFIVFSDLHIHNYKKFSQNDSRLNDTLNILEGIFKFAHNNEIHNILFAGDLYDKQTNIPVVVVNRTMEKFKGLFQKYPHIEFYAISGNHDLATKNIEDSFVSSVQHLEVAFDNFHLLDNDSTTIEEVPVVGIPYCHTRDQFNQYLKEAPHPDTILLIHQQPDQFWTGECDADDPLFQTYAHVFCGHIHEYRRINNKFTLIGNPLHRDLGDAGQEKGFLIYDSDKKDHEFISTEGMYPEFIKVENEDEVDPDDDKNFIVVKPKPLEPINQIENDFSLGQELKSLVKNYWKEVDGKDKEKLKIGLKCVTLTSET